MRADRAWLVLVVGLPACSSGGSSGAIDAGPIDATASAADGGSDATTPDAAATGDGGSDVAAFGDGASDTGMPDGDGSPTSCSGTPQSLKGTCVYSYVDGGPPIGCIAFTGSEFAADPATLMATCATIAPSTYTMQPCPTAGLVGKCIDSCGQPNESVAYYYSGTAASVQQTCASASPPGYFVP